MQWDIAFSENTLKLGSSVLRQARCFQSVCQKCFATAEAQEEEGAAVSTKPKPGASRVSESVACDQGRGFRLMVNSYLVQCKASTVLPQLCQESVLCRELRVNV